LRSRAVENGVLKEIGCKGVICNCVVQDRVKIWAVVKTVMSIRIITEEYLDRPSVTERMGACRSLAVCLPEIYFAGFTCRVQKYNDYISKQGCYEGIS